MRLSGVLHILLLSFQLLTNLQFNKWTQKPATVLSFCTMERNIAAPLKDDTNSVSLSGKLLIIWVFKKSLLPSLKWVTQRRVLQQSLKPSRAPAVRPVEYFQTCLKVEHFQIHLPEGRQITAKGEFNAFHLVVTSVTQDRAKTTLG